MPIHERLNMEYWKQMCSLQLLRERTPRFPASGGVTGPCTIAALEQLRDASYGKQPGLERVPTDVFIWSRGESEQRSVTKIGGLLTTRQANPGQLRLLEFLSHLWPRFVLPIHAISPQLFLEISC
jgi:hypothetical protein